MKKLILRMSVSADGFVGGPKGEADWIFATGEKPGEKWRGANLWNASMHLMGSRTYYDMASWWPTSKESFAAPMNEIPKAIFSRKGIKKPHRNLTTKSVKDAQAAFGNKQGAKASAQVLDSWLNPKVCTGNLTTEIKRLKRGSGKPLLAHGGAGFARSLIKSGLIDEFQFVVHPVLLGKGMPIFTELPRRLMLKLVECVPFRSGAVGHVYRPRAKQK